MQPDIHVKGSIVAVKSPESDINHPWGRLFRIGFMLRDTLEVFGEGANYDQITMTQSCYEQKVISMYLTQIEDMGYVKRAVYRTLLDDMHMDPHSAEMAKTQVATTITNTKRETDVTNQTCWTVWMDIQIDFLTKMHCGQPAEPSGEHGYARLLERLRDEECNICQNDSPKKIIVTTCHHIYHIECIFEWFRRGNHTCPMCRSNLAPIISHKIEFP